MIETTGVLLVRRVRWWAEARSKQPRNAALDLSEDQVARKYRGVDGRPWPEELSLGVRLHGGLAGIEHWPTIATIARAQSHENIYDAIILAGPSGLPVQLSDVEFLGFDCGFYNDEYSVFSSIYHEAIHGPQLGLRRYAGRLNQSLLLPTAADVESYRQTRDSLRRRGQDVEDEDCYAIAVFGQRRHS